MMGRRRPISRAMGAGYFLAALVAFVPLATAGGANADWLVTREGARIETKGAWKVQGNRVVFTQPNGVLGMMRAAEVDLDASALATAKAVEKAVAPAEAEKKASVLKLTEQDIPPMEEAEATKPAADKAAAGEKEAEPPSGLEVTTWRKVEMANHEGVEIYGTIRNTSKNMMTRPTIQVRVYGSDGKLLATADGNLNAASIPVGKSAEFHTAFPGVLDFSAVKFDPQGVGYKTNAPREDEKNAPPDANATANPPNNS